MHIKLSHQLRCTAFTVLLSGVSSIAYSSDRQFPARSTLLSNQMGESTQWSGVGKIVIDGKPQCTASLIVTRSTDDEGSGPAYILTAGHCALHRADNTFADVPFKGDKGKIVFNYFSDTPSQFKTYKIKRVRWSTMRGSDLAILELDASLADLIKEGIEPFRISQNPASSTQNIRRCT